jgi:hypothetical protein
MCCCDSFVIFAPGSCVGGVQGLWGSYVVERVENGRVSKVLAPPGEHLFDALRQCVGSELAGCVSHCPTPSWEKLFDHLRRWSACW